MAALYQPARYKCFFGGRGAGKSHGVALWLLAEAARRPFRILCCREFQSSMRDSVHRLLVDMILKLGLEDRFTVEVNKITSVSGSEFIFEGLRHNITRIRSLEGIDKVWVEEAQTVSNASWETLIPTIRKDGSEIIITFNPELETDATYQRFVVNTPPNAVVVKLNYHDNPWFPSVLQGEMEHLRRVDPDAYQHVWLGECRLTLDGAIYARELREATEDGRICSVPYDPTKPVSVYCDLGWADMTAIWMAQHIAGEVRLIDYLEDSQRPFNDYLHELQAKPYIYDTLWLPHDAQAKSLGTGRSIEEISRAAGWRVRMVPKLSVADGINAVRTLFPTMWFDREKASDGLQALRHYRYDLDPNGQFSRNPLHDAASHGCLTADAEVLTERGQLPITSVRVGDRVWTPCGFAAVTHAGPVKKVAKLVEIGCSNGAKIHCSLEHKFLTQRGFVRADTLRYSDRLFRGDEWPIRLIALCSKVRRTGFRATITGEMFGAAKDRQTSIGQFGRIITALCLRGWKSITSTAIPSTTTLATWPPFLSRNISASTLPSDTRKVNSNLRENWLSSGPPNGTAATRDANGMSKMAVPSGLTTYGTTAFASNAASRFVRLFLRAPSGAISIARWQTCDSGEAETWVYDLTVKNHACYRANGVLVSNSDALRYAAVAMQEHRRAKYPTTPQREPIVIEPRSRANTAWMRL